MIRTILDKNAQYILAKNAVGYGIYQRPYYYFGERCCGLIRTSSNKEELEAILKESGCEYIELDTHPDNVEYQQFSKLFKEAKNANINN